MIGGIDNQIQQRIMASGNNPDRLMQSYNQNKQLIDLLALQKLKSDKEAAARNMQMQMQQNPQTIKDQREAEVLNMTKQELAQQVGKTLAQKQQQSQQNLQRIANQGIANAPAANRMRMAGGGIVGFAKGGDTSLTEDELKSLGITRSSFDALPKDVQKQIVQRINDQRALKRAGLNLATPGAAIYDTVVGLPSAVVKNVGEGVSKSRVGRALGLSEAGEEAEYVSAMPAQDDLNRQFAENQPISKADIRASLEGPEAQKKAGLIPTMRGGAPQSTAPRPPVLTEDETDYLQEEAGAEAGQEQPPATPPVATTTPEKTDFSGIATITAPQLDYSGDTAGKGLEAVYRGMSQVDPSAARETGYKSALDKIGYTADEMSGIKALQAEQKALEDKRLDPKKQARDRLISRLLGARGSTLGSTFRTSGLAGERTRGAQEAQEYALFEKRKKDLQDLITKQQGIRSSAYNAAQTDFTEAGKRKDAGLTGLKDLSGQYQTRVQKQAELKQAAEIANATNSLKKLDIESRENVNRSQLISNEAIANARVISNEAIAKMRDDTQRETNKLTAETNKIIAEGRNMDQLNGQLTKIQKLRIDIQTAVADELKSDFGYTRLRDELNEAMDSGNEAEYLRLQKQLKIIENRVLGRYQDQVKALEGQVKLIQDRLLDLTSGDASYEVQR